jgi:elongation factor Ts|tara:strand:- start:12569 stop:13429 length:861 start_codon:yes stop_codon:yes gene_type:complete
MSKESAFEQVKELRKLTGAGFKDCNIAIKDSNGDIEKAIEILRVKGISKASKKMTRDAKEGVIIINDSNNYKSILEINCETDFVAKNEEFINFVKEIGNLNAINKANIDNLKKSKMKNNLSVEENLVNFISKIGEKITIGRTRYFDSTKALNISYLHGTIKDNLGKLGVIVSLETNGKVEKINEFGKKLAMHVAASNPLSIDKDSIDKDVLSKEELLINEELKSTGKSDEIIKKISLGKINKFKEDNGLLTQQWVMDPKKKVLEIIKELNISDLKIKDFYRIKIGE